MTASSNSLHHASLIHLLANTLQKADERCPEKKYPQMDHKKNENEASSFSMTLKASKEAYKKLEQSFKDQGSVIVKAISKAIQEIQYSTRNYYYAEKEIVDLFENFMTENILKDVFKYINFMENKLSVFDVFFEKNENLLNNDVIQALDILHKHHVVSPILIQKFDVSKSTATNFLNNPFEFFYVLRVNPSIINNRDQYNKTLLHYLAREKYHDNLKIILHLLFNQKNPSIDLTLKDENGNTAIHSFLLCYLKKKFVEKDDLNKYQEMLNMLLKGAIEKLFDFKIKNNNGISVKQLIFVYRLKIMFDINYIKETIKNNDGTTLTKELFSSLSLNPIKILKDYDNVILEKMDEAELEVDKNKYLKAHVEIKKLIFSLKSIRDYKSFIERFYAFFSSKDSIVVPEKKDEKRHQYR